MPLWNPTGYVNLIGKGLIGVVLRNIEQSESGAHERGNSYSLLIKKEFIGGAVESSDGSSRTALPFEACTTDTHPGSGYSDGRGI